jgi:hypothetical protein
MAQKLAEAHFENSFVAELPGDSSSFERQSRQTPGLCFSRIDPVPVQSPELLLWSDSLAAELGILGPDEDPSLAQLLLSLPQ